MRQVNSLGARIKKGEYAVKVGDSYHVYEKGEVTLERLKEIFPGLPIYQNQAPWGAIGWLLVKEVANG